jgi:N-acetylglucosaminylphosphatidylinositol deacetylase
VSLSLTDIGNNYGIGETRKLELKGSCASLGIDPGRCVALDVPDIQDNPRVWWDEKVIQSIVKGYVEKWHADAVSLPNKNPSIFR